MEAKNKQTNEKEVCWLASNSQGKTVFSKTRQEEKVFRYVEYWTRKLTLSTAVSNADIFFYVNELNLQQM